VEKRAPLPICAYVLGVAVLATVVFALPVLSPVQDLGRDALVRAASKWPPARAQGYPDVAVVALDGRSLRAYGDWPWPRSRYAELTRRLDRAGAAAIAFDIDFSSPRDPALDAEFAEALRASGRVVLGSHREFQHIEGVGEVELASFPIPVLEGAAARIASATVPLDPDGAVRRTFHSVELQGSPMPSMARAALEVALGEPPQQAHSGSCPIDFRRIEPPIPILSFVDLLEDRFDPRDVAGRSVFVGATAPVLQDLWATPVGPAVPGVLIQAIEHRQHAARRAGGRTLAVVGLPARFGVAVAISLIAFLAASGTPRRRALRCLLLAGAVAPVGLATLILSGLLLDAVVPLCVIALHYLLGLESLRRHIDRRLTDRELSLSAIIGVGQLSSDPFGARGARTALELLGNVIGARSLALLRLDRDGGFSRRPIRWAESGPRVEPSLESASEVLESRSIRVFEAAPDRSSPAGAAYLYAPLIAAAQPLGVLVVEREAGQRFDPVHVGMIATVGVQVALSIRADELIADLQGAVERANAASHAKSAFLANMSHEIRTPMTAVIGYADLLADPETPCEARDEFVDLIRRNGNHLLQIINDILDLSRIEEGKLNVSVEPVSPAEVAREVERLLRDGARAKGLRLEAEISDGLPESIETDPLRLRQILLNLVGNGVKFTESGSVRLRVAPDDPHASRVRFSVEDSGIGMDEKARARIFEPFFQGDTSSTRQYGGTGLGLAIARRLVECLEGDIAAESTPGVGTRVTFRIPARSAAASEGRAQAGAPIPAAQRSDPASVPKDLSGRVLLAEDSPDNQRIIERLLSRSGLEVEIAENGQVAYEKVCAAMGTDTPFDLVFMDVDMPVLDGYQATGLLREAGYTGPIVALTAHALPEERSRSLEAGCDDHLTKPVERSVLIENAARHLADRKRGKRAP